MYGKRLNDLKQQYPRDIAPLTFLAQVVRNSQRACDVA